jgi:hypothetical protein
VQHIYILRLTPTVMMREDGEDILLIGPSGAALRLKRPGSAFRTLLDSLSRGGMDRDTICEKAMRASAGDEGANLARLYFALDQIERKGFVHYTLARSGRVLATLEPVASSFRFEGISADAKFLMSRFACLRRVDNKIIVESPLGHARMRDTPHPAWARCLMCSLRLQHGFSAHHGSISR